MVEESKDVYMDIATKIVNILAQDPKTPYISQKDALDILYPTLSTLKTEVSYLLPNAWFNKVDKDKNQKITTDELAAHLRMIRLNDTKKFMSDLEAKAKLLLTPLPTPVPTPMPISVSTFILKQTEDNQPEHHDPYITIGS